MRFLVDENISTKIRQHLQNNGHDIQCVVEIAPGMKDADVLNWAIRFDRIFLTSNGRDFVVLVPQMENTIILD